MRLTSLFTGNPHFVNLFALTTLGIGIPMVYLHYTAPTEDEKERRSVSLSHTVAADNLSFHRLSNMMCWAPDCLSPS